MTTPLKVLTTVRSPRGYLVVPVHFRHDPEKDDDWELRERAKYANPADADRELDFDTRQVRGSPAYPSFSRQQHVVTHLRLLPSVPLRLSCDFNVDPMVWDISQIVHNKLMVLDEVTMRHTDVSLMMKEFRNAYPAHQADIYVYGDASGNARSANNRNSCYDEMRLGFRGYPSEIHYMYGLHNPPPRERMRAVNSKLKDLVTGEIGVYIDPKCKMLIADFEEVVTEAGGNDIHKSRNSDDPYFQRTHASDGLGYLIHREWPIYEKLHDAKKPRDRHRKHSSASRRYARVIGAI